MKKSIISIFFLILLINPDIHATNKIIVDNFSWQISDTEHFSIYYCSNSIKILPKVADYLEKAYNLVCKDLHYQPPGKTPFFFYLTHNQFEQNNIVDVDEGTGGVTEAYKYRFLVPYTGSEKEFAHVVTHEFTHVVEFNQLLNGFWKSARIIKSSLLNPLWLMEGLAEYESGHFDSTIREMYVRDAATSKRLVPLIQLHGFSHLKPHQILLAYKESESAIRFIEEEYGKDKIPLLLQEARTRMDISSTLMSLLGIDLFTFDKKWQEYLEDKYASIIQDLKEPEFYGKQITYSISNIYEFNTNAVWNKTGEFIYFLSDRNGATEIYKTDIHDKNWKLIYGLNHRNEIDSIQIPQNGSAISCSSDDNQIVFVGKKNQQDYLCIYHVSNKKLNKISFGELDTLSNPSFSPDGQQIVFVGMMGGTNDLYLYDLENKKLKQLNSDQYNESCPSFSPDGKTIVFSSEENKQYDLFTIDLQSNSKHRITNTPADELYPCILPNNDKIVYISDYDGIYNMYLLSLADKNITRLTNVIGAVFSPKISFDGKKILFSSFRNGEIQIYCNSLDSLTGTYFETIENKNEQETSTLIKASPLLYNSKYKMNFSTDLFFPLFFYSSYEGLYLYSYWQASEMLGNHQIGAEVYYNDYQNNFNYNITYSYRRWRPQFTFTSSGINYFYRNDTYSPVIKKEEQGYSLIISYPFDTLNQIQYQIASLQAKENVVGNSQYYSDRVIAEGATFIRNTISSKYLITPLSGEQLYFGYLAARKILGGNQEKLNLFFGFDQFIPVFFKHDFHWSVYFANSSGPDASPIQLNLRGIEPSPQGLNVMLSKFEYRFPIYSKMNYHMWYMLPDFFFKYLGGIIFTDYGYTWQNNVSTEASANLSYGIGLRFYAFLLQSYPITIGVDVAHRPNSDNFTKGYFIFTLGFQ